MRFLLILLGIFLIYVVLKNYARNLQRPTPTARPPLAENMVRCAHCGVNIPVSEAIFSRGEHYCTDEHRKRHQP